MKKKGFTLVELLAVFTVLSLIATLVLVSINQKGDKFKNISYTKLEELIQSEARAYISTSPDSINSIKLGNTKSVTFNQLIEKGYLTKEGLKNPRTNKKIDTERSLVIIGFSDNKYTYEVIIYDK